MKKILLAGVAALSVATFAAAPAQATLQLDLGGYFKGYVGFVDQDDDAGEPGNNTNDFEWKREAEIHFTGETVLDNGLGVGVHVEMEAESDQDDGDGTTDIEESYVYFFGNWGRINAGSEDGAAYLLQVAAPSADSNVDGMRQFVEFINTGVNIARSDYDQNPFGTSDKVTYLTPKFSGFQAGVSWAPENDQEEIGDNLVGMKSDAETGQQYDNAIEIAARYDGTFQGVGVHVGAGYSMADQEVEEAGEDDFDGWNVGLKLTYAGFSLGGVYTEDNNGLDDSDDKIFVVGLGYDVGPYHFGVSYFDSERENSGVGVTGDHEYNRISAGAGYTYGPGMTFRGSVNFYELENDANAAAGENDAFAVILGTDVAF